MFQFTRAPTNPTITSITPTYNQITINFTPPTNNGGATITNYKYSLNNGSTFISAGTTTTPIIVTGLSYNATYQVIIRAVNSFGDGTQSNMVSVTIPTLIGSLNYSFVYTGAATLTQQLVLNNIPIKTLLGTFDITSTNITIVTNNVNVEIATSLQGPITTDFGITFNFNSLTTFYNGSTNTLTFNSSNNCPFSRNGSQFLNLTQAFTFNIQSNFIPYFLPRTSLERCFQCCTNFNSNISNWDTSNVTTMDNMFNNAKAFNQPIGNFNTQLVTSMESMFQTATAFNQNINTSGNNWNVSKVTNLRSMFNGATAFKQDISNWTPYACTNMTTMFQGVDMNSPNSATNQTNYNALLNSWGNNPRLPLLKNSLFFNAGTSKYTNSVAGTARLNLTKSTGSGGKGWNIADGGVV